MRFDPRHLGHPALVLAALLAVAVSATSQPPADPAMNQMAIEALQSLVSRDDTALSRTHIVQHNLDRYFTTYPIPRDDAETQRLLGTADRIIRSFARRLWTLVASQARREGSTRILPEHVQAILGAELPLAATRWNTIVVFPELPAEDWVTLELIDLQAFHDIGLVWNVIGALSLDAELVGAGPPMTAPAVQLFAEGVNAYGLLILRLGGRVAAAEHALDVRSPHLREAEKIVRHRAGGDATPLPPSAKSPSAEPRPTLFTDVTESAGLVFRHVSSEWIGRFRRYGPIAPTFSGGGVTAGDLDGDEWPDLVVCGGQGCVAFRNRGDGTFEDFTAPAGINAPGEARMSILADLDNDGDRDLFITYAHATNRLFENQGGGRFRDITERSGLSVEGDISGPVVTFDFDGDARLDLYVGNFGNYIAGDTPWVTSDAQNAQPNRLYRNLGDLRFEDVTERTGTGNTGWAQALSHVDWDRDGDQDLYIANDFGHNELLENQGDGTFRPVAATVGAGDSGHGMNVAFSDLNVDGRADILVTNIWGWSPAHDDPEEYNVLLLSSTDDRGQPGFVAPPVPAFVDHDSGWSWAALFFDRDNDGDDDIFLTNGHSDYATFVQYRVHPTEPERFYPINNGHEPNLFYRNDGGVIQPPDRTSGAERAKENSRGLALLDYDRDGDLDLAITAFHGPLRLYRNDADAAGNWLVVELVGDPGQGVNRDAIGSQLIVHGPDGLQVWRTVTGGEGYLGMSTLPIEVGLGAARIVDLEVVWPGGERQTATDIDANGWIVIRQGQEKIERRSPSGAPTP